MALRGLKDPVRTRLQAAYEICPELREVVEALELILPLAKGYVLAVPRIRINDECIKGAEAALAKLDKIK